MLPNVVRIFVRSCLFSLSFLFSTFFVPSFFCFVPTFSNPNLQSKQGRHCFKSVTSVIFQRIPPPPAFTNKAGYRLPKTTKQLFLPCLCSSSQKQQRQAAQIWSIATVARAVTISKSDELNARQSKHNNIQHPSRRISVFDSPERAD